jgi:Rrf2 family protein
MKISAKGRYALRVMVDIASIEGGFVSISEISKRQDISQKYLEQIIALMSKAGLVESMRGATGGYKLAKKPSECSVADILSATDDMPKIDTCETKNCAIKGTCKTYGCWQTLSNLICDYLKSVTLEDLINKTYNKNL